MNHMTILRGESVNSEKRPSVVWCKYKTRFFPRKLKKKLKKQGRWWGQKNVMGWMPMNHKYLSGVFADNFNAFN